MEKYNLTSKEASKLAEMIREKTGSDFSVPPANGLVSVCGSLFLCRINSRKFQYWFAIQDAV